MDLDVDLDLDLDLLHSAHVRKHPHGRGEKLIGVLDLRRLVNLELAGAQSL